MTTFIIFYWSVQIVLLYTTWLLRFLAPWKPIGFLRDLRLLGNITEGATPVPIPNTAVKPFKVDGTIVVRLWESRTLPGLFYKSPEWKFRAFLYCLSVIKPKFCSSTIFPSETSEQNGANAKLIASSVSIREKRGLIPDYLFYCKIRDKNSFWKFQNTAL